MGADKGGIEASELAVIMKMPSLPDLLLPVPVEALELVLETLLTRWGKDGDDAQTEAKVHDSSKVSGMTVGALEDRVVIELNVSRKAPLAPVRRDQLTGARALRSGGKNPDATQAAPEGNGRKGVEVGVAAESQALDKIKRIQLGLRGRQGRQVPARRWCWPALALQARDSVPCEDPGNRAIAGRWFAGSEQSSMDGRGATLAQWTMPSQPLTQR